MSKKTIAMRVLDSSKIRYDVLSYDAKIRDAILVANDINVSAQQVFKTLVVLRRKGKPMLVMIPADRQLNLKRLAKEVGEKKVKMASHAEAEKLTGLQVGGISALALLNHGFEIFLDKAAESFEKIFISAGKKGLQIKLSVEDLQRISRACLIDASD